ncbi:S-adenosyl-L-methionine-dependent methyltransferase, partial [Favolaschia claudopus]
LRQLLTLLSSAVDTLEGIYTKENTPFPSLDKPWNPRDLSEAVAKQPEVVQAKLTIVAAAEQLMATVRDPYAAMLRFGDGVLLVACLRTVSELNVVEILREAGSQGLHVKEIAAPSKVNPDLLARMLRALATNHIFLEVASNVFTNNRISSSLDKGKPSAELFAKPEERLKGNATLAAVLEMFGDDLAKSYSYLADSIHADPTGSTSPMALAFNIPADEPIFHWMMRPENQKRTQRFDVAMHSDSSRDIESGGIFKGPIIFFLLCFDWSTIPNGGIIVDVGGGLGGNGLAIAKKYSTLRVVNQDIGGVVEKSKAHWKEHLPSHVEKGLVEFQSHDFFTPQPVANASAFLLRHVTHDWTDPQTVKILRHLRDAATPNTHLVVIEGIIPSIAEESSTEVKGVEGAETERAPKPLLPNWGAGVSGIYSRDMLLHFLGGKERTAANFVEVFKEAGWKVVRIHRIEGVEQCHVVGVPA